MCYDRSRELTPRLLMRLYYLRGDRAESPRQCERCAAALEEELGISPSKSTIAIFRQILADQLDEPTLTPVELDTSPEVQAPPLLEILSHLSHLQRSLTELQNEVQQSIQMVELTLHNNQ